MIKHLTRHGNSLALVIERGVLDLLDITRETPLEISTDGRCLVVAPVRDAKHKARVRAALARVNRRSARALRKLAE